MQPQDIGLAAAYCIVRQCRDEDVQRFKLSADVFSSRRKAVPARSGLLSNGASIRPTPVLWDCGTSELPGTADSCGAQASDVK